MYVFKFIATLNETRTRQNKNLIQNNNMWQTWNYFELRTLEWEILAVETFGEFTNKTVGKKYFGKLTQYTTTWRIS